jgi:hypothetical protein
VVDDVSVADEAAGIVEVVTAYLSKDKRRDR